MEGRGEQARGKGSRRGQAAFHGVGASGWAGVEVQAE